MDTSLLSHPLFGSLAGATAGALLTWLLRDILKTPQQKRLEKIQKASLDVANHSPVFQNMSGEQRNVLINYVAASTSANSAYIATGQGVPIVPDVQRWIQAARTEDPRPITRFTGEILISQMTHSEAEVFYPARFRQRPTLQITPEGGTARLTLDQRPDGFKVKADHYSANTDAGVKLKWFAEGELAAPSIGSAV